MAIKTFVKNLIALIGKKRRQKEEVKLKFCEYKGAARMLAVALEGGIEFVPNFLENSEYCEYISCLTLMFSDNGFISLLLYSLEQYGFKIQKEALQAVRDNHIPAYIDEEGMRQYIVLLRSLFYTPDPQ
jgi:hypothetical protein